MTISHPTSPPHFDFQSFELTLVDTTRTARHGKGKITSAIEVDDPYYSLSVTTKPMNDTQIRPWRSWKKSLRGSLNPFLIHNPIRQWPSAHSGGIAGWDGIATLDAVSGASVTIGGLPDGFIITEDDHLSIMHNGKYFLASSLERVAKVDGQDLTFQADQVIPTSLFPISTAVVNFYSPKGMFRMIEFTDFGGVGSGPISFTAGSTL